jgi:hypothetical protein
VVHSGKPAAADLQLGLATAPVLFAARTFPQLELLIGKAAALFTSLVHQAYHFFANSATVLVSIVVTFFNLGRQIRSIEYYTQKIKSRIIWL